MKQNIKKVVKSKEELKALKALEAEIKRREEEIDKRQEELEVLQRKFEDSTESEISKEIKALPEFKKVKEFSKQKFVVKKEESFLTTTKISFNPCSGCEYPSYFATFVAKPHKNNMFTGDDMQNSSEVNLDELDDGNLTLDDLSKTCPSMSKLVATHKKLENNLIVAAKKVCEKHCFIVRDMNEFLSEW